MYGKVSIMSLKQLALVLMMMSLLLFTFVSTQHTNFTFNGFDSYDSSLSCDGSAYINYQRVLKLTTDCVVQKFGHAFYGEPVTLKNHSTISFSTTFVFAIKPEYTSLGGHGLAFVISPTVQLTGIRPSEYLGLFNDSNNGNSNNHIIAIELDTVQDFEFDDIDDNHVGIDINGLHSTKAVSAGYHDDKTGTFKSIHLVSGHTGQVWIEYDGVNKIMNVTLAPINVAKPSTPLLSLPYDISPIIKDVMYVGFSASTGLLSSAHCILGWSFITGSLKAPSLNYSALPQLSVSQGEHISVSQNVLYPVVSVVVVSLVIVALLVRASLMGVSKPI